jgi:hypothetical protein
MAPSGEFTDMSYFAKLQQNVVTSTLNSHDANILAGATWTGTAEDTLGVAGLQLNIYADQNIEVTVSQSMNGTDFYINDVFTYYAAGGGDSWTTQATAAYVLVSAKNLNAATATTAFHMQLCLCPIVEALPRALDTDNRALRVSVEAIDGLFNTEAMVSPANALKTAVTTRLAGAVFSGSTLDGSFWATTPVAGGTATLGTPPTGQLTLETNGTANGSVIVNSQRTARYVSAATNYFRAIINTPAITGANVRRWGAFDVNDGYFFEYNGTTLKVVARKNAADVPVSSGAFNGPTGLAYVIDATATTYEIYWTNIKAYFLISGKLLHTITGSLTPSVATPHLKIGLECTNTTGNTNNNLLECRVASINRLGALLTQPLSQRISSNTTTNLKYGPGNLHSIIFGKIGTGGNTMTVYDGNGGAGTVLHVSTMTKGTQASDIPVHVDFKGLPFYAGLSIVTTTGTAGDFTVVYE